VITDLRYPNEVEWVKHDLEGVIVHISRIGINGQLIPPANDHEEECDPVIQCAANYHLQWETVIKDPNNQPDRLDFLQETHKLCEKTDMLECNVIKIEYMKYPIIHRGRIVIAYCGCKCGTIQFAKFKGNKEKFNYELINGIKINPQLENS